MKIKNQFLSLIVLSLLVFSTSCNKDEVVDQEPQPQAEVISKVQTLPGETNHKSIRYDNFLDAYHAALAKYDEIKNTPYWAKDKLSATIFLENTTQYDLVVSSDLSPNIVHYDNRGTTFSPFSAEIYKNDNGFKSILKAGNTLAILAREGSSSPIKGAISFETQNPDPNVDKVHWNIGFDLTNFDRTSNPFNRNSAIVSQSLDLRGHQIFPTISNLMDARLYENSNNLLKCEAFVGRQTEKLGYIRFTLTQEQI